MDNNLHSKFALAAFLLLLGVPQIVTFEIYTNLEGLGRRQGNVDLFHLKHRPFNMFTVVNLGVLLIKNENTVQMAM